MYRVNIMSTFGDDNIQVDLRDTFTNQSVNAVKYVQVIQHFRSVSTTMNEIFSSLIKQVITKY